MFLVQFEITRNTGDGAACADARHQHVHLALFQDPTPLGVPDHRGADAAFYRVCGIAALDFDQQARRQSSVYAVQLDQRCSSDAQRIVGENHVLKSPSWERSVSAILSSAG